MGIELDGFDKLQQMLMHVKMVPNWTLNCYMDMCIKYVSYLCMLHGRRQLSNWKGGGGGA